MPWPTLYRSPLFAVHGTEEHAAAWKALLAQQQLLEAQGVARRNQLVVGDEEDGKHCFVVYDISDAE